MNADRYDQAKFDEFRKKFMDDLEERMQARATRDVEYFMRAFIEKIHTRYSIDRPSLFQLGKECYGFKENRPEVVVRCCAKTSNKKNPKCGNLPRIGGFFTCELHRDQEPECPPSFAPVCPKIEKGDDVGCQAV